MASIVSDQVGCAPDLVAGKSGVVFRHDRPEELVESIETLCGDSARLQACQAHAEELLETHSIESFLSGIQPLLRAQLDEKPQV